MKPIKVTWPISFAVLAAILLLPLYASSQTVTLLHQFSESDSGNTTVMAPLGDLVLSNGYLYGTVSSGGANNCGMIFAVKTNGSGFRVIHNLNDGNVNVTASYDGYNPIDGLTMSGSTLYGTCYNGGVNNAGTIFEVGTNGSFTVLHAFAGTTGDPKEGAGPHGQMVLSNNILYGTTQEAGTFDGGTVFAFNLTASTLTALFNFSVSDTNNGSNPVGRLVLTNGVLYGVTDDTDIGSFKGTVYSIPTNGTSVTTLHKFTGSTGSSEGADPDAGLLIRNRLLFGTTRAGGTNGDGTCYFINFGGTTYQVTYNFGVDGAGTNPTGDLVVSNAVLFGTTSGGGGTIFEAITAGGDYVSLCNVGSCGGVDLPPTPFAGLVMDTNGVLYGTTSGNPGADVPQNGAVFSIVP